ncbi:hypothetical protein V6615_04520 [Oscillospiraceae bacterium PP1C4]
MNFFAYSHIRLSIARSITAAAVHEALIASILNNKQAISMPTALNVKEKPQNLLFWSFSYSFLKNHKASVAFIKQDLPAFRKKNATLLLTSI